MEHGRYIHNREQFEVEERINLMTPYWKSIRREIPTGNSLFEKKLQNFPVKYTQAINWELYRNDVIGMCDAAVERNPDSGDSSGTIGNAAMKIRDLMEQIFEKTGKKQELELELLNDRHRFTTAMEAHVNMEAAMQGKWKKDGKNDDVQCDASREPPLSFTLLGLFITNSILIFVKCMIVN
jgi:hypothetical protein